MISRKRFFLQFQLLQQSQLIALQTREWDGERVDAVLFQGASQPMDVTFEELCDGLSRLPRMYLEMDGSFVWRGEVGHQTWQVDGLLHDRAGKVQYVEIKGSIAWDAWLEYTKLLTSCRENLIIHAVDRGCFMRIEEVERILWGPKE